METASQLSGFGGTQQELLRTLLRNRGGQTVEKLSSSLGITRTAVNQHLSSLEREGYLDQGEPQKTRGRPGRVYLLTPKGVDLFPRQYSWFSTLLLGAFKDASGSEGTAKILRELARKIAGAMESRLKGKSRDGQMLELIKIMNELEYDARLARTQSGKTVVEASNCVYHGVASVHPEVCEFDLELLGRLSGSKVEHQECIVRGGSVCRFALSESRGS